MASVFLIRHEEPAVRGVLLGRMDSPLSAEGHRRAQGRLGDLQVRTIWSSPLLRASQTAAYVTAETRNVLHELQEIDLGEWTGLTWTEIEQRWPEVALAKLGNWLGIIPPSGEGWAGVLRRADTAIRTIRAGPFPAAVVAHAGINAALAHRLNGRDPLSFEQGYGEVICVDFD